MAVISICIPVYNRDIRSLAGELLKQVSAIDAPIQLVVLDDGSEEEQKKKNHWLKEERDVLYLDLEKNIGRAAIRNRLAEKASGKNLLFLDDDSGIIREDFLEKYLEQSSAETVRCGGREYPSELPAARYSLHYRYGRFKESRNGEQRSVKPYASFHSNNFLIPKEIWKKVSFDENLGQYGHEDTLFGFHLKKQKIPLVHIDNPVLHAHLETNEEFLRKSRLAVENLKFLYDRNEPGFAASVKMLKAFQRIKNSGLQPVVASLFQRNRKKWEYQLLNSEKPSMRIFNLYKLGYLCRL